jgi:Asp-tRNA(Asn)/Glu-tRNA(Gln) amidotransferase A subunit family amidase
VRLTQAGVEIATRESDRAVAELESALDDGFVERQLDITAYEMKWPYEQYVAQHGALVARRIHDRIAKAKSFAPGYYESLLAEKAAMRERLRTVARAADGFFTLAASGPAPRGLEHTGSRTFLVYATLLGVPAFSLPLMSVEGMPLGLQLIGIDGRDGDLCAVAHWLMRSDR